MEAWKKDSRLEVVMTDLDALVPKDHLLRKIEKVLDYDSTHITAMTMGDRGLIR